jgi:hypothetical protein
MAITTEVDPDPLKGPDIEVKVIRAGIVLDGRPNLRRTVHNIGGTYCNERGPDGRWVCTRPGGHPQHWKHVAVDGLTILEVWGGGPNPTPIVDPEDGTPKDPEDLKVDTVQVGKVYRLRDRSNQLQVIGGTDDSIKRSDGLIEVLDLHKREFRTLPQSELVPSDYQMTLDDMTFVVTYTAKVRRTVRDEGVRHYHAGRWCEAGLQDALRDQGLPRYEPEQTGYVVVKVPYRAPSTLSTRTIKAEFTKAVDLEPIKGVVYGFNDHDLELTTRDLEVKVEGVTRR